MNPQQGTSLASKSTFLAPKASHREKSKIGVSRELWVVVFFAILSLVCGQAQAVWEFWGRKVRSQREEEKHPQPTYLSTIVGFVHCSTLCYPWVVSSVDLRGSKARNSLHYFLRVCLHSLTACCSFWNTCFSLTKLLKRGTNHHPLSSDFEKTRLYWLAFGGTRQLLSFLNQLLCSCGVSPSHIWIWIPATYVTAPVPTDISVNT